MQQTVVGGGKKKRFTRKATKPIRRRRHFKKSRRVKSRRKSRKSGGAEDRQMANATFAPPQFRQQFIDVSEWTTEAIKNTHLLDIFNYIRFNLFHNASKDVLTKLFVRLANIPLKNETIIDDFLNAIQTKDIVSLVKFAKKYEVADLNAQIYNQVGNSNVFIPDMKTIIDIYMENEDEQLAHALLGTFFDSGCKYEYEWNNYVGNYKRMDKANRWYFVSKMWNVPA